MQNIAFVNYSFRRNFVEQLEAFAGALGDETRVIGLELFSSSAEYPFGRWQGSRFLQVTLFDQEERDRPGRLRTARRLLREIRRHKVGTVFMCHYERPGIFLTAVMLRLRGCRVIIMQDSKFDDYRRFLWREVLKSLLYAPYQGALVASRRSADYVRFLGVSGERIRLHYYAASIERIRAEAGVEPAPGGAGHSARDFICVARLVPKKNHMMLLDAYASYAAQVAAPRRLILCGSGPLEDQLRKRIAELGLQEKVVLKGNLGPVDVAGELGGALCLLLPSLEEQYGIAIIEAQAMGLPVIVSDNVGARDEQVRSGVNGFVVESDNPEGMACFMRWLAEDEQLWRRMSHQALASAEKGDVGGFVRSALDLIRMGRRPTRARGEPG